MAQEIRSGSYSARDNYPDSLPLGGSFLYNTTVFRIDRDRLRVAIASKGLSQRELARVVGMRETYLSNILNGHKSGTSYAAGIARALGVPIEDIIDQDDIGAVPGISLDGLTIDQLNAIDPSRLHRLEEENAEYTTAIDQSAEEMARLHRELAEEKAARVQERRKLRSDYKDLLDRYEGAVMRIAQLQEDLAALQGDGVGQKQRGHAGGAGAG